MENYLQIADHWVTIIAGIFTILLAITATWLAYKTYILTKRDKQKTIAINELKQQTEKLEQLYLIQIAPHFVVKPSTSDYIKIVNIGEDAYKVNVLSNKPLEQIFLKTIDNFKDFYSSGTEKTINYSAFKEHELVYSFEDKLGNKYEQILFVRTRKFSNLVKKRENITLNK